MTGPSTIPRARNIAIRQGIAVFPAGLICSVTLILSIAIGARNDRDHVFSKVKRNDLRRGQTVAAIGYLEALSTDRQSAPDDDGLVEIS